MNSVAMTQGIDRQRSWTLVQERHFAGALVEFRFNVELEKLAAPYWETLGQALADLCMRDGHAILCRAQLPADAGSEYRYFAEKPSAVLGAGFGWRRPSMKPRPADWHEITFTVEPLGDYGLRNPLLTRLSLTHRMGVGANVASHQFDGDYLAPAGEVKVIPWELGHRQYALLLHLKEGPREVQLDA